MPGFGAGGGGGGLFGNANQNNQSSQGPSLFGSTPTSGASSAPSGQSLFGATSGNASSSGFGNTGASSSGTGTSTLFGSAGQTDSSGNLFGSNKQGGSGSSSFTLGGNKNNDNSSSAPNPFASLGTPNKQSGSDPRQQQAGSLFGQMGSSTPANKPSGPAIDTSTTPAGPPPANASASLFGNTTNSKPGGLFGSTPANNPSNSSSNPFGGTSTTPSTGGLFANVNTQNKDQQSNQTSFNMGASTGEASKTTDATSGGQGQSTPKSNLFPSTAPTPQQSSGAAATTTPAPAPPANLFGGGGASKDAGSSSGPTPNLFGALGQKSDTTSSQPSSGGLFASASAAQQGTTASSSGPNNQAASTAATTSGPSLFGATTSTTSSAPTGFGATGQTAPSGGNGGIATSAVSGLGASTTGQPPSAQSRLKNKSMDDIITRWASDLTKYQKEFQGQAEKVAQWDRQLVENSNAISKLYSKTFQAERDTAEIQKQLTAVESHQDELSQWLDRYEQEVDDLMSRQINPQDGLQGPDQERERTYKTAENVSDKLSGMGQDLTSMIEEINAASSAMSKTNRADDPLSQIVRVLNGHLSQLQQIDQGTAELQGKVAAAQREGQRLGARGRNGIGYDAAEDFGRSFRSRT